MSETAGRAAAETTAAASEGDLVANRLRELHAKPVQGNFDIDHLKAVHAAIFQDLPHHRPGVIREDTYGRWTKFRALEGSPGVHAVHYAHEGIENRLATTLAEFGGPDALRGQTVDAAAGKLAALYGALDFGHGFHEGNSRTLREFTRELAAAAGFELDWTGTSVGAQERNALYVARDVAVLEHAFPGLTPQRGMETNDREEYEASLALPGLRRAMGTQSLEAIIRHGLAEGQSLERDAQAPRPAQAEPSPPSQLGVMTIEERRAAAERLLEQIDQRAAVARQTATRTADLGTRRDDKDLGDEDERRGLER